MVSSPGSDSGLSGVDGSFVSALSNFEEHRHVSFVWSFFDEHPPGFMAASFASLIVGPFCTYKGFSLSGAGRASMNQIFPFGSVFEVFEIRSIPVHFNW